MKSSRNYFILSILVIGTVLLDVCPPSEACYKKFRALLRNKGKEEKPAELARDEAAFIKYSHAERSNFYIEIMRLENKTIIVRELDHPPISMNQVVGEEFQDKKMSPEEPDAEYINTNGESGSSTQKESSNEAIPPERSASGVGGGAGDSEEVEILSPEDENIRREWGGECMAVDWNRCNKIRQIVVLDVINNQFMRKNLELDCLLEPILCLRNGWTANRCHILCMASKCNKQLYFEWDTTVDFEGPCRYRK